MAHQTPRCVYGCIYDDEVSAKSYVAFLYSDIESVEVRPGVVCDVNTDRSEIRWERRKGNIIMIVHIFLALRSLWGVVGFGWRVI